MRSNAGSVVRGGWDWGKSTGAGQQQKSMGADMGIVLVQTSLDTGKGTGKRVEKGVGVGVRASAAGNRNLTANRIVNTN